MAQVLVIDSDSCSLDFFDATLRRQGYAVHTACSGKAGVSIARSRQPEVVLSDLWLPDLGGLELLRRLRADGVASEFLVTTSSGTIRSAVEATRLGAFDYLEKPLTGLQVVQAVGRAVSHALRGNRRAPEVPAASAWARLIAAALTSTCDPRTVDDWCSVTNMSRPTLQNRCRALGVSAKSSLDFARVLRSFTEARRFGYRIDALLNCDPRTLERLSRAAGLSQQDMRSSGLHALNMQELLEKQTFITDPLALDALRTELRRMELVGGGVR